MTTDPTTDPGTWIDDWTKPGVVADPPADNRPPWMRYLDETMADGDKLLGTPVGYPDMSENRLLEAQAHYLRAIAAALAEIAMHAEPLADSAAEIKNVLEVVGGRVDDLAGDVDCLAGDVARMVRPRRRYRFWARRQRGHAV